MEFQELSKNELIDFIYKYDSYIIEKMEDEQNTINNCPVCVDEFLNNEYIEEDV